MIRTLAALPFLALLGACASSAPHAAAPNTLSAFEEENGVELLFDGKTTNRWRAYKGTSCPAGWQVVDGALSRVGEAGDIVTKDEYQDFVFDFEWKVAPGSNSGVIYHVSEDHDAPWETGPEYQILDNVAHKDGLDPRTSAAANYAMHAPTADLTRPAGEWNEGRIVVIGPHVEHWLNGKKVVEYELWSPDWKTRVAGCKWKDHPDYGMRHSGRISLQDHGDAVSFRNLKIRRLKPAR